MMPQRKYFSFQRQGQLLQHICAREASALNAADVYWTLGFIDSSFAGEFCESLVQALYLCPMIVGLSFLNRPSMDDIICYSEKQQEGKGMTVELFWPNFLEQCPHGSQVFCSLEL